MVAWFDTLHTVKFNLTGVNLLLFSHLITYKLNPNVTSAIYFAKKKTHEKDAFCQKEKSMNCHHINVRTSDMLHIMFNHE